MDEVIKMDSYPTLRELIENDPQSKSLFEHFSPDAQVALQEQRQSIHTYADLERLAASFEARGRSW